MPSNQKYLTSFEKCLDKFLYRFDVYNVFNDFLTSCICAYSGGKYEDEYFKTIEPYKHQNLIEVFPEMLSHLVLNSINNPYSDLLGDIYMNNASKSKSQRFGQFFTPDTICDFMAQIGMDFNTEAKGKTVLDPACGSGRMLLSGAKLNHNSFFFGADLDPVCAKMAALNLSINGMRGEIACMNSLSNEWFFGYQININSPGITKIEKDESFIYLRREVLVEPQKVQLEHYEQLELQLF